MFHRVPVGVPVINAARVLGAVAAAPRQRDPDRGFGVVRQMVGARPQDPARDDGVAVGQPGDDGTGDAVRSGGEVRVPGSPRVAALGDGAMQMIGNGVLITAAAGLMAK